MNDTKYNEVYDAKESIQALRKNAIMAEDHERVGYLQARLDALEAYMDELGPGIMAWVQWGRDWRDHLPGEKKTTFGEVRKEQQAETERKWKEGEQS